MTPAGGLRAIGTLLICLAFGLLALAGYGVVASLFKGVRPKDVIALPATIGVAVVLIGWAGAALCGFAKSLQRRSD